MRNLKIICTFFVAAACARAEGKRLWAKSFLGKKGPEIFVEDWITKKPDTKGKWVMLDIWETW
ncbi:MAG: hypothetical protein QF473_01495 [Planctomycetota bacterium]|jgi:hypothetical protein|nr:hypothetical protein [Planctomycetota bacterium]